MEHLIPVLVASSGTIMKSTKPFRFLLKLILHVVFMGEQEGLGMRLSIMMIVK